MQKELGKCCASCMFASVDRTAKGRIKKDSVAKCRYEIPMEQLAKILPASVLQSKFNDLSFSHRICLEPLESRDDCLVYRQGLPLNR